jgi:hypothetical protein
MGTSRLWLNVPLLATTVYHNERYLVHYAEHETFEILAFGMMQAHWVVDGVAEAFDDAYFRAGIDGGAEDDLLEKIGGKMLRTRKSQQ